MALTHDLINQFVKLTEQKQEPKEVTVNGVYKIINGEEYVQIDGSEIWTPVTSTVEAETGERVKVMIKNHTATVTGNISSPSARSKSVNDLKDEVDKQGNTIKQLDNTIEQQNNSIIQINNNIDQVNNNILQANNAINQQGNIIKQLGNEVNQQGDKIESINNDITAHSNEITQINNTIVQQNNTIVQHGNNIEQQGNIIKQQGNEISQHGNKIDQLNNEIDQQGNSITQINNKVLQQNNVINQQGNIIDQQGNQITEHNSKIVILNTGFQIVDGVLTGLSAAVIDELKTNHLDAEYADINFANINYAAVEKLFTESGIIKDLVVKEGHITGELVGVTIKGDLIEGNTVKADKLVVLGSDGLYYKLNVIGETVAAKQTNENSLNGKVITAKSITADRINVTDLVAFGATIGGYNITEHSLYSGGKNSATSSAKGVYLDDDGQISFGDATNFVKFFKDTDNKYKLRISADELYTSSNSKSISEQIKDIKSQSQSNKDSIDGIQTDLNNAIVSIVNLYYASDSSTPPNKPTSHIVTDNKATKKKWNIALPTYSEEYPYLYTCKEMITRDNTYSWTTVTQSTYAEEIKAIQNGLNTVSSDYLKESSFSQYQREQLETNQKVETRLKQTSVTIYGNEDGELNPDDAGALINQLNKVDNDINGDGGLDDRMNTAEGTIEGTGLNDYDQRIKITQRFLNVETDVSQIKNIFKITGGTNLVQNSVGYFADNKDKPTMWSITPGTIYKPFGYDGDLTGVTVSRGRLFCAKGSIITTQNNITALMANRVMSISFKYKNGDGATSKIKIYNGSITLFEKEITNNVNTWTEYTYNAANDPALANPTFICPFSSVQISIESSNKASDNNNGIEISDLMLNYGDVKPWELCSNEVYGAMVKISSLGIEVTATTAKTKNFMTTDGILVFAYDPATDSIIGTEPITKITDFGTVTNSLLVNGDIQSRKLVQTMIHDASNNDVYVEYIK